MMAVFEEIVAPAAARFQPDIILVRDWAAHAHLQWHVLQIALRSLPTLTDLALQINVAGTSHGGASAAEIQI